MAPTLRTEDLDFLATAPRRWTFEAEVAAPQRAVFDAISADPGTWAAWYPGLTRGHYEGDPPYGVGSTRQVRVGGVTFRETILAWDAPTRWVFRVDEASVPMASAVVEEWRVEPKGEDHSEARWTFAIDPRPLFKIGSPLAPTVMGALFRRAMRNLGRHLA